MRTKSLIPLEGIEQRVYIMRGHRVMLSTELAGLYGVEPRVLVQAVKRNIKRFPEDFMFQLNAEETRNWKSQFVISNPSAKMGLRTPPYAFTEQGVSMLSSVLKSERAIQVNIAIMRAFVKLREMIAAHRELAAKLRELERKVEGHDEHIQSLFDAIRELMEPPVKPKPQIGFKLHKK